MGGAHIQLQKSSLATSENRFEGLRNGDPSCTELQGRSFFVCCSQRCFLEHIGILALKQIGATLKIDVADDTLSDVCWKLTKEIVQCTDAECMDYVQQRLQHNESLQGACEDILLELDEGLEVLDKDEEVDARKQ